MAGIGIVVLVVVSVDGDRCIDAEVDFNEVVLAHHFRHGNEVSAWVWFTLERNGEGVHVSFDFWVASNASTPSELECDDSIVRDCILFEEQESV